MKEFRILNYKETKSFAHFPAKIFLGQFFFAKNCFCRARRQCDMINGFYSTTMSKQNSAKLKFGAIWQQNYTSLSYFLNLNTFGFCQIVEISRVRSNKLVSVQKLSFQKKKKNFWIKIWEPCFYTIFPISLKILKIKTKLSQKTNYQFLVPYKETKLVRFM